VGFLDASGTIGHGAVYSGQQAQRAFHNTVHPMPFGQDWIKGIMSFRAFGPIDPWMSSPKVAWPQQDCLEEKARA